MDEDESGYQPIKISVEDSLKVSEESSLVVASVILPGQPPKEVAAYPLTTPSGLIAQDSTANIGIEFHQLELQEREVIIEKIERVKKFGEGITLDFGISEEGVKRKYENKPRMEIKTTIMEKWARREKK